MLLLLEDTMDSDNNSTINNQSQQNEKIFWIGCYMIVPAAAVGFWFASFLLMLGAFIVSVFCLMSPITRIGIIAVLATVWAVLGFRLGDWISGPILGSCVALLFSLNSFIASSTLARALIEPERDRTSSFEIAKPTLSTQKNISPEDLSKAFRGSTTKLGVQSEFPFLKSAQVLFALGLVVVTFAITYSATSSSDVARGSSESNVSRYNGTVDFGLSRDEILRRRLSAQSRYGLDRERWNDVKELARHAYPKGW
jgi:hypothetical protein